MSNGWTWPESAGNLTVRDNVGIGVTNPSTRLEVDGAIAATSLNAGTVTATAFVGSGTSLSGVLKNTGGTLSGALTVNAPLIVTGGIDTDSLTATGGVTADSFTGDGSGLTGVLQTSGGTLSGDLTINGDFSVNGAITANSFTTSGAIAAGSFAGNGSSLTGVLHTTGGTLSGDLTINTNLSVNSAITANSLTAAGTITANRFTGDGSGLTGVLKTAGGSLSGDLTINGDFRVNGAMAANSLTTSGAIAAGSFTGDGSGLTGVLQTSGGTLSGDLTINGDFRVNGAITANSFTTSGAIAAGSFTGDGSGLTGVLRETGGSLSGALTVASLTVGGAIATNSLTATGNVTAGAFWGDGSGLTGLVGTTQWSDITGGGIYYNGGDIGVHTATPEATLDIVPTSAASRPWFRIGAGGDSGRFWVDYANAAPRLVLSDLGDPPRIQFQQTGTGTETEPEFSSWIGHAGGRSNDLALMGADVMIVKANGRVGIGQSNPQAQLDVGGDTRINGTLQLPKTDGGFATFTNQTYDNESAFQDNNLKLTMGYISPIVARPSQPLEYEFAVGHVWTAFVPVIIGGVHQYRFVTRFNKSFSIDQEGDLYCSGNKAGYVADYFINRVGDSLEQGDVVVLNREHPVCHYTGSNNNIPVPEVDLTDIAYDARVCGIVVKVVTEKQLPYVEVTSPPEVAQLSVVEMQRQMEAAQQRDISPGNIPHPLQAFAAPVNTGDRTKIANEQMGKMVTLGAFSHCKVDADIAPIQVGDLLTTSPTRGHAQKVLDRNQATGAIIGKALQSLDTGKGKIPIIVFLQ